MTGKVIQVVRKTMKAVRRVTGFEECRELGDENFWSYFIGRGDESWIGCDLDFVEYIGWDCGEDFEVSTVVAARYKRGSL